MTSLSTCPGPAWPPHRPGSGPEERGSAPALPVDRIRGLGLRAGQCLGTVVSSRRQWQLTSLKEARQGQGNGLSFLSIGSLFKGTSRSKSGSLAVAC